MKPPYPLLTWMQAMRAPAPVQKTDWDSDQTPDPAKVRQQHEQAATEALAQWHATHATPWLIAAIVEHRSRRLRRARAHPGRHAVPQTSLTTSSPAWTAATYNRLRLMPDRRRHAQRSRRHRALAPARAATLHHQPLQAAESAQPRPRSPTSFTPPRRSPPASPMDTGTPEPPDTKSDTNGSAA